MVDLGTVGFQDVGELFAPQEAAKTSRQALGAALLLAATGAATAVLAMRMATLREKLELLGTAGLMIANGGVIMARSLAGRPREQALFLVP